MEGPAASEQGRGEDFGDDKTCWFGRSLVCGSAAFKVGSSC